MYVEGLIIPVKTARKDDYLELAKAASDLFIQNGASRVVECWGADIPVGKETDFQKSIRLKDDETAVLAWLEFPDKATRDMAMEATMQDPTLEAMRDDTLMGGARMIFGGFNVIMDLRA